MHDLIVVGAGPCGLACAVEAKRRGLDCLAVDKACLCASIVGFPTYMTFFSTPDLLELGGLPFALDHKPQRHEVLTYYARVVRHYQVPLRLYAPVRAIERRPDGAFDVCLDGERLAARAVCVATGYFDRPRRLGVPGEDLPHVSHDYREPFPFFGRRVVVVGGRNSAASAALDLYRAGAQVTLVYRGAALHPTIKYWLRPDLENRIREGAIGAVFRAAVTAIEPGRIHLTAEDEGRRLTLAADHVLLLTGYEPDLGLLRGVGVSVADGRPRYDPETHETDVPGVFVVGVQADPAVIIEEGRHHGARVAEALAERRVGR